MPSSAPLALPDALLTQKIAYAKTPSKALSADARSFVPAAAMKVTVSHAQKEADDLKRAREEEDTIAERGEKRLKADGVDAEMAADGDDDGACPAAGSATTPRCSS